MASRDFAVNVLSYLSLFSNSCRSHAKRIRESSSSFSRLACLSSRVDFDNRFSKSSCVLAACRSILLATLSAVSLVRPNSFSRLISFSTASAFLFLEIISSSVVAMILFISASSFSFRLIKSSIAFPSSFVPILYICISDCIAILFAERVSLYRSIAPRTFCSVFSNSLCEVEPIFCPVNISRHVSIIFIPSGALSNKAYISCARSFNSGISLSNPARNSVK